ncbi:hypothetical protein HDU67_009903, partial [Dinochytrium kinnereticum]
MAPLDAVAFAARLIVFIGLMEGVSLAINVLQCFSFPLHWISYRLYRVYIRITEQLFGSLMTIITHLLCPVELVVTGDHVSLRSDERIILMSNHQTLVDWWYIWLLAWWKGAHGDVRIILKDSLKWIPIVGWGMQFFEFIFLSRKIAIDESRLRSNMSKIRSIASPPPASASSSSSSSFSSTQLKPFPKSLPLWLILFPEGTVYTPDTIEKSNAHADRNGIPRPKHTILPRSTGFRICLEELALSKGGEKDGEQPSSVVQTIQDVTMAFEGPNGHRGSGTEDDPAYDRFQLHDVFFGGKGPRR